MKYTIGLVAFLSGLFCHAQKQDLRLHLVKGAVYHQSLSSRSDINQTVKGQMIKTMLNIGGRLQFEVKDVRDSVYEMEAQYDRLDMTIRSTYQNGTFSSDSAGKDVMSTILASMTHQPFLLEMTNKGRISHVHSDALLAHLFDNFPQLTEDQKAQLHSQMEQTWGEQAFISSFEMVTAIFPDHLVGPNEGWTVQTNLRSLLKINANTEYRIQGITDSFYTIYGACKISTDQKNNDYTDLNGMPAKYNLTGTMNSVLSLDKKSLWINHASLTQQMGGTVEIKDCPKFPGGGVIDMQFVSEIKVEE